MLKRHQHLTGSTVAERVLGNWKTLQGKFVKVMPSDYKRVLSAIKKARQAGVPEDQAVMEAVNG
jgi:glutamate synthase domain-containing protein 3